MGKKVNLVTRKRFAEMAGVSAPAVTKACSNGLKQTCHGKRIDTNHPSAVKYLKKHAEAKTSKKGSAKKPVGSKKVSAKKAAPKKTIPKKLGSKKKKKKKDDTAEPYVRGHAAKNAKRSAAALKEIAAGDDEGDLIRVPEDIESFADMTLRDLIDQFGTCISFKDWLSATKMIEEINERRLKNAVRMGELVHRDLVRVGIIDPLDAVHIKLLSDGSKSIARRVTSLHDAGTDLVDIEAWVSKHITSYLKPVKIKTSRALKYARDK